MLVRWLLADGQVMSVTGLVIDSVRSLTSSFCELLPLLVSLGLAWVSRQPTPPCDVSDLGSSRDVPELLSVASHSSFVVVFWQPASLTFFPDVQLLTPMPPVSGTLFLQFALGAGPAAGVLATPNLLLDSPRG